MSKDQLYNHVDEAIIPAGRDGNIFKDIEWEKTRIVVTDKYLIFKGMEHEGYLQLNNIYNLDKTLKFNKGKGKDILNFFYKKGEETYFGLIKSARKDYLKRSILVASISTIPIFFISPYRVGGRVQTDEDWVRGILEITPSKILIKDVSKKLLAQLTGDEVFRVDSDRVKGHDALKISYIKDEKEKTDLMYSPGVSLSILHDFFKNVLMSDKTDNIPISEVEKEMMLAIESGINSSMELSELTDQDHRNIIKHIDALKEKGFIKEIGIDKIVDLTSAGKKKIGDSLER